MGSDSVMRLQFIDRTTLTPVVHQALGNETVEVIDWDCQQIHGGTPLTGVFRLSGNALDAGAVVPWSLVLKAIPFSAHRDDPSHWWYWEREALVYRCGLLSDLPGGLTAPRCLGVIDQPDAESWIWMEDVRDHIGPQWPLEHYRVVARHLGQFNGAYLMGRAIPSDP